MERDQLDIELENDREVSLIKEAILGYLKKWPIFILGVVIAFSLAHLSLLFKPNVYQVESTIKVKGASQLTNPNDLLFGRNSRSSFFKNNDESKVLLSFPLIQSTVEKLNLNESYYLKTSFGRKELYDKSPIKIEYDASELPSNYTFKFQFELISDNQVNLRINNEDNERVYEFGELIEFEGKTFKLSRSNEESLLEDVQYEAHLISPEQATYQYKNLVSTDENVSLTMLIPIRMKSSVPQKAKDFLNTLVEEYITQNLADKNEVADNTIDFIDNQLKLISDSLSSRELSLEQFKSEAKISDISIEAQMFMSKYNDIETQKAQYQVMREYYDYLKKSLNESKSTNLEKLVTPSAFGIQDEIINQLVAELISLSLSKKSLISQGVQDNPLIEQIENRKQDVIEAIGESIDDLSEANNLILANLQKRANELELKAKELPSSERQLVNLNRLLKLNENIYLFLMQKRSDAAIQRSSNVADCKVIEPARLSSLSPVSPNRNLTYIISIILGVFIPLVSLIILDFLNDKLKTEEDLQRVTNVPILGSIPKIKGYENQFLAIDKPKSSLAESFRIVRANLSFYQKGQFPYLLTVTSNQATEGKTFTSVNLASILASSGKKTLIVGLDLRKPRIHTYFNLANVEGVSDYLKNNSVPIENVVKATKQENLYCIVSGSIPPNPAELLLSEAFNRFVEDVKKEFDYIVFDTPPVSLVTDAFILNQYVDKTLFVLKSSFTKKEAVSKANKLYSTGKLKNLSLLLNNVPTKKGYGSGYYEDKA